MIMEGKERKRKEGKPEFGDDEVAGRIEKWIRASWR